MTTVLIYAAIIGMWAVVLVPMWLRRSKQFRETRTVSHFNSAMGTLRSGDLRSRRKRSKSSHGNVAPARTVMPARESDMQVEIFGSAGWKPMTNPQGEMEQRPESELLPSQRREVNLDIRAISITNEPALVTAVLPEGTVGPESSQPIQSSDVRQLRQRQRVSAARAAARRRRVLAVLAVLTVLALVLGVVGVTPLWLVAAPLILSAGFLVTARHQVVQQRMRNHRELRQLSGETAVLEPAALPEGAFVAAPMRTAEPTPGSLADRVQAAYAEPSTQTTGRMTQTAQVPIPHIEVPEAPAAPAAAVAATPTHDSVAVAAPETPAVAQEETWDAIPQTLPTYVSKPAATMVPRVLDRDSDGAWTGQDMLDEALQQITEGIPVVAQRTIAQSDDPFAEADFGGGFVSVEGLEPSRPSYESLLGTSESTSIYQKITEEDLEQERKFRAAFGEDFHADQTSAEAYEDFWGKGSAASA